MEKPTLQHPTLKRLRCPRCKEPLVDAWYTLQVNGVSKLWGRCKNSHNQTIGNYPGLPLRTKESKNVRMGKQLKFDAEKAARDQLERWKAPPDPNATPNPPSERVSPSEPAPVTSMEPPLAEEIIAYGTQRAVPPPRPTLHLFPNQPSSCEHRWSPLRTFRMYERCFDCGEIRRTPDDSLPF